MAETEYTPEPRFMRQAIDEAQKAKQNGDYAIGAVVVRDNVVLGSAGNRVKISEDPTQHAEMEALRDACRSVAKRHLEGAVLYTTAEPCPMCATAAVLARLSGIVSGSTVDDMAEFRRQNGNHEWTWRTFKLATKEILESGDPHLFLVDGYLREECRQLFHTSEAGGRPT